MTVSARSLLLAAALMLDHAGFKDLRNRLGKAIDHVLNADKVRTGDLGGRASTREFTRALIQRISA